jgi:hypothetical protein
MAEIPGVPDPKRKSPKTTKARITTTRHWAAKGALVPWMLQYLQWLAQQPSGLLSEKNVNRGAGTGVTWSEKTKAASRIARKPIYQEIIRILEQRPDAITYFEKLRADIAFRAREMMSEDIAVNIEARREGLVQAREAQDHKAIKGYTDWLPDVAFPKKSPGEESAPRITIYLGSKEAQALVGKVLAETEDVVDVEWEEIETKQLESGEDD